MDTQPLSTNCCPKCHTPLPPDAPQGLCPKCLFAAVATPTEAGQPAGHRATPPPLEEIAAAFPQLEILEFIGQGGMGFVFKARQPKLDRLVALKILPQSLASDPTFAERFNREAKLLARLSHPGIVTVHDFGVASHQPATLNHQPFYYLLMEFVDGVNLRQAMQAGRFTPEQALAIVPKICEALQFAHNEGILHRDIKPENILLDAKGRVKLADFGIAKLVGEGRARHSVRAAETDEENGAHGVTRPTQPNLTEAGKTLGTPNYMAPEQLDRPQDVDHRADIYSLGVVFYEMLTGELPLGRFAPPSQKSAADPRVDEVVLRALEKEKARRYASADEVRTQVETISTSRSEQSESEQEDDRTGFGSAGLPPTKWTAAIARSTMVFFCIAVLLFVYKSNDSKVREYWDQIVTILLIAFLTDTLLRIRRWKKSENAAQARSSQREEAQTGSGKQTKPRLTLRAVAGAVWVVLVIIAIISMIPERRDTTSNEILAEQPSTLRKLPTDRVIEVGLAKPKSAWAWKELATRMKSGRLDGDEANRILDGLAAWMRRDYPQGYNQPLFWIDNLLDEWNQPWILSETNALAFLEAFYGNPSFWPVPRIRENETTLDLRCEWRSSWLGRHSLEFELLNEMRSISIDGRQVPTTYPSSGKWKDSYYYGRLQLPKLAPGKHVVRCEVDSAFVADHDMPGLAKDASSKDWPPTKRRWTRVCEAEFMVYSADAEIVRLTDEPALNPVAGGALSCPQIIIRSESGRLTATAPFDVQSKVGLPISVNVALRLAGQTFPCGKLFAVKTTKVPIGTLGAGGDQKLTVEIGSLDAQIKEAEIVLTPNPKAVEEYPYVDRIWGKEIVISHVPLSRQDLYGAKPSGSTSTP